MRRIVSVFWVVSLIGFFTCVPLAGYAVWDDTVVCPGTGQECLVHTRMTVTDADGIIDVTHPAGSNSQPLTLHILPGGALVANTAPLTPLVIKAGAIIVDGGGAIVGDVFGGKANSLTLIAVDTVPPQGKSAVIEIHGTVEASALRLSGNGGDGGTISVTSSGSCQVDGDIAANGSASTSAGGAGGDIGVDCTTITVNHGALIGANASGPGAVGGSISLISETAGLTIMKGSTLSALGSGLDGGSISLATNGNANTYTCAVAGKILLDAKTVTGPTGVPAVGTGGNVDISCGGDLDIQKGARFQLSGDEGGGGFDAFCGGNLAMEPGTKILANGTGSTGGSVELAAANNINIAGKIQTRSGGTTSDNDGAISATSAGDLVIAKGATLDASAGRPNLQAGQIILAGGYGDGNVSPHFTIETGATLKDNGHTAGFGSLDVDLSGSNCSIGGRLLSSGKSDNGVAIGLMCDSVSFSSISRVQATAKGGAGGTLSIDTTAEFGGTPGDCVLGGKVILTGTSGPGLNGGLVTGRGGSINATCGAALSVPDGGSIDVGAGGAQGVGGQVTLSSSAPMHVGGTISAKASGSFSHGGQVTFGAPDIIFDALPGTIDVGADAAGVIQASATGTTSGSGIVHVQKTLNAKGSVGGNVVISGCDVNIDTTGWLHADGSVGFGGTNEVRARSQLTILGKMTATNGVNSLVVNASMAETAPSTVKPPPVWDHSLTPCQ